MMSKAPFFCCTFSKASAAEAFKSAQLRFPFLASLFLASAAFLIFLAVAFLLGDA
jgi:hypothetical protein